jgi:hypothetical protein
MGVVQEGSNIVVNSSIVGSVLPTTERELVFPVLVDGSSQQVLIEGSLYGRTVELRGDVWVRGPIVARGDTKLNPTTGRIQLDAGLTVNGSINCVVNNNLSGLSKIQDASVIIKGDLAVNQNIYLRNAIVFGSIRATNCVLENTLVLGTCLVDESLKVSMSSIGGYAARDVVFEGSCLMLHGLGESLSQPLFLPCELSDGVVVGSDLRYYPAIRESKSIMNLHHMQGQSYPEYSKLFPSIDWVRADTLANPALDERNEGRFSKWILSIGGRVSDISKISQSISNLTLMLKCGFEYEHYNPLRKSEHLDQAIKGLTTEEAWILRTVCH